MCDRRRSLKRGRHKNEESRREYQKANAEVRKAMKKAKENWVCKQCTYIDQGNDKTAYNTLNILTRTSQPKSTAIEDRDGNLLTNNEKVKERWTEYCSGLYNVELNTDISILDTRTEGSMETPPILKEEVEAAIGGLKSNKSPGIDNVPSELLKYGGEEILQALTDLCQKIMETKTWPKEWTQSLVIPIPKKGNLKQCTNYRTISLISHPSKIMLRIILNRLRRRSEEVLSEEQAGFRAKRSTVEQVFNSRILIEKCLQHQRDLCHNFIDFKKAFDRSQLIVK